MPSYYIVIKYSCCTPARFAQQQQLSKGGKIGPSVNYFGKLNNLFTNKSKFVIK